MLSPLYVAFAILLFLAVVLLVEGVYLWWNDVRGPEARRIERRLSAMSAGAHQSVKAASILKQRLLAQAPLMERMLLKIPRVHRLDRLLEQSGVSWSVAQFIVLVAAAAIAGAAVVLFLGGPAIVAIVAAVLLGLMPMGYVLNCRYKRLRLIDTQLPDALDLMGRALRAGHAFPSALQMVGDQLPPPIATEFGIAFDEVNYGIAMKDALLNLATRVPSTDLRYFVIAVTIQRETGGNLAELLDNIAALVRGRHKLMGTIRVLSAEGRLSAWILCLLPFVLALVIQAVNPDFLGVLWTDLIGIRLLIAAGALMLIGIVWTRRIVRIHV